MENNAEFVREDSNAENKQVSTITTITSLAQMNHKTVAKNIIDGIIGGEVDPLSVHVFLKRVEALTKSIKADGQVSNLLITSANNHSIEGKTFSYLGADLKVGGVHTSYDFSTANDILWNNLDEIEKQVKEMKKDREKFLTAAFPEKTSLFGDVSPKVIIDNVYTLEQHDCGEEVTLSRPLKRITTGVITKFK